MSELRDLLAPEILDALERVVDERIAEALDPEPVLAEPEPRLVEPGMEDEPDLGPFESAAWR